MARTGSRTLGPDQIDAVSYRLVQVYDSPVHSTANRHDHVDPHWACWYLRQGGVRLDWEGGSLQVGAGQWAVSGPGLRRSQRFSADAHLLSLRFEIGFRGAPLLHLDPVPWQVPGREVPAWLRLAEALVGEEANGDEVEFAAWRRRRWSAVGHARMQAAFHAFVADWLAYREAAGHGPIVRALPDPRLAAALALLDEVEGIGPVPYGRMCHAAGLSRSQLDRLLPRHLGCSARAHLERRCLARAEALLTEADHSAKQIAARLGFTDGSHFAKWFRRQTGVTPRVYRSGAGGA